MIASRKFSAKEILAIFANAFDVQPETIIGPTGDDEPETVTRARQFASRLIRQYATSSFHATGQHLGDRNADEMQEASLVAQELVRTDRGYFEKMELILVKMKILPENHRSRREKSIEAAV